MGPNSSPGIEWVIRKSDAVPPGRGVLEVVERKGLGHPDTICDGVAEHVSRALCRAYLERFGAILHHNVDKVLLVGGASRAAFGEGEIIEPMEIYLAGRATRSFRGASIPVEDIAVTACREWLSKSLRYVDLDRHVRIIPRLRPGSTDLTALYGRGGGEPAANDTSCGVGFAPLSELEQIVLTVESQLTSSVTLSAHPAFGEDVKIMGIRAGDRMVLTIGCALVARHVPDRRTYELEKAAVRDLALAAARGVSSAPVDAVVNAADDLGRGELFLTAIGTSAEAGDDGEVGRGNRANGLITPYRPMTLEAAAGKNPVTHVGKLYNVLATRVARAVAATVSGVEDATCVLVSRIGAPVSEPALVDLRLVTSGESVTDSVRAQSRAILREHLSRMDELRDDLVAGRAEVY